MPFLSYFFLRGAPEKYLYITLFTIPLLLLVENIYYILIGYRYLIKAAAASLARPTTYLLIIIYLYFSNNILVFRVIQAYVISMIVALLLGLYFFLKCGFLHQLSINLNGLKQGLWFGLKQHLGSISQLLNYRLDFLIIAYLLDSMSVGIYSIAVLMGESVWYISKAFALILYVSAGIQI